MNLLWAIESIIFLWGIIQMKFNPNRMRLIAGIIIIIVARLFKIYCPNVDFAMIFGAILGPMFGSVVLFDSRFVSGIIKYWFAFTYVNFIYLPVELLLAGVYKLFGLSVSDDIKDVASTVLVIFVLILLSYFIKKNINLVEWIREIPYRYYFIAFICALSVNGIGHYVSRIVEDANIRVRVVIEVLRTVLSIFVYMLGIGFAFTDFFRKKYREENILKDRYIRMSQEHYDGLVVHMQEIRKIKHDMQAHINVLNKYAVDDNFSALKDYLNDIAEQNALKNYRIVNTGIELIDAIITDGINKAKANDIVIECEGVLTGNIGITDFDLCTIFSNLLSNAVEACNRLQNSEKKVHIALKDLEDEVRIIFENPVEWEIDTDKIGTYTSKKDKKNHGFGIDNVRKTVEKYNGNIVMGIEDGKFRTVIIFYK